MRSSNVVIKKTSFVVRLYLLPPVIKMLTALALFVFICASGVVVLHQQSAVELTNLSQKKAQLEKEVAQEAKSYGELVYLSKNAKQTKERYEAMIKQFPPEFKMGDLLASITKLGTAEGLKFVYFKPLAPVNRVYYAEVPVDISVVGQFHQIGRFLSDIANLPGSVIAVNNFTLTRLGEKDNLLSLQFTATLYNVSPASLDIKS